ncbi:DegT/DnrJ/EryC1/StrS aminotransferase family protein [Candidatus Kaiserbacteria bacterium]|nr:MAG: DegT/DnrJ/EryC1/StrS aminotransferase family protein [Candidatus Kaiserbacteria bacterium]
MEKSFFKNEETKEALIEFIRNTDRFSMGQQCAEFETAFAKWQGRKYAAFVSSGSMANLVLIQSLLNSGKLQKGDKVGFSAVTWPTNVMPLLQLGLEPVPLDCELDTLNTSSAQLVELLSHTDLKAFFITNVLGFADDIDTITNICRERGILLIEDNCESIGTKLNDTKLGNFGLASTFSTFIGHHLSTIEGGVVCTDDEDLYHHLLMCRAHGWDRNLPEQYKNDLRSKNDVDDFYSLYTFYELAYNARPTEIQGFLGNHQIQYLDQMIEQRHLNFEELNAAVINAGAIGINSSHLSLVSNFSIPVVFKEIEPFEILRDLFIKNGVEIRPIIAGNILNQPFYKKQGLHSSRLPNAEIIHNNGFYFTNRPDLTNQDKDLLIKILS